MDTRRSRGPIIAIDGPAGAGKSTLARRLAIALDLPYINTGLMYRAVTHRALTEGIDVEDEDGLAVAARSIGFAVQSDRPDQLAIDGSTSVDALMSSPVEERVSTVSRHPSVRMVLRDRQRQLGIGGSVMEGRDIGTVVFPDADVKVFLVAASGVRADRRAREDGRGLEAAQTVGVRDEIDSRTNPFVPAPDAFMIDATNLTADEVFDEALEVVQSRLERGISSQRDSG
ncbi:MAG TPA: (d)CMP kinase [Actinomycetota bacterium]|nr:(d)CMP kinase [Actinomycetota bacterium]